MALPRKKEKKPGLAIGIMVGKPKASPQDDIGSPKGVDEPDADEQGGPPDNDEDDQPQAGGGETGECQPDPEAVCFRSEAETCGHCTYMQGSRCSHPIVAMPVAPGDSCNAFQAKQEGQEQQPMPGQEQAPTGGQPVEEQS